MKYVVEGETYYLDKRYVDYEDFLMKSHHYPFNDVDVLPRKVASIVGKIYFKSAERLVNEYNVEINKEELFDICLRVYKEVKRIRGKGFSDLDKYIDIVLYIYLYLRGFKVKARGLNGLISKIISSSFDAKAMYDRFIKMSVARIAQEDILLQKILGVSILWLRGRVSTSPSTLIDLACRIASILHPFKYPYSSLKTRFKEINKPNYMPTQYLKKLGIEIVKRTPNNVPTKVLIPISLCKELRKVSIDVPEHVECR
ncbi:MAG: hypothetical protein QXT64_01820 [Desulfurococcaceae archaeon]